MLIYKSTNTLTAQGCKINRERTKKNLLQWLIYIIRLKKE